MSSRIFIADRIKVGFQKRSDTFTNQLGYVIYYDSKQVLRKQSSWESWRDKTIDPKEFDNTPQSGFMINKGIVRGGDWFSDKTTKIRIWDPRGFEFEISIGNLINLLMHSDVSRRDIDQQCVYGWEGQNLVLLPINCELYQQGKQFTKKQALSVSAKNLVIGHTYQDKQTDIQWVYLGKHTQYQPYKIGSANQYRFGNQLRQLEHVEKKKVHVFYCDKLYSKFKFTQSINFIANEVNNEIDQNTSDYINQYFSLTNSQRIIGIDVTGDNQIFSNSFNRHAVSTHYKNNYIKIDDNKVLDITFQIDPHTKNKWIAYSEQFIVFDNNKFYFDGLCGRDIRAKLTYHSTIYESQYIDRIKLDNFNENTPGVGQLINDINNYLSSQPKFDLSDQNKGESWDQFYARRESQVEIAQKCLEQGLEKFQLKAKIAVKLENNKLIVPDSDYFSAYKFDEKV